MAPSIFVRRLKITDLAHLEVIETALARDYPSRPNWLNSFRTLVEQLLTQEPEGLLIAEADGVVVGWAAARQQGVHPMSGRKDGHIFHVSVAKAHRGLGYGPRLIKEAEAYLRSRGCGSIHVSVLAEDAHMAELFKKAGYKLSAHEFERTF